MVRLEWHQSRGERLRLALLGARATDIRLRTPEAYEVHRRMLDFRRKHSPDGIPGGAVGLDRATLAIMRWGMAPMVAAAPAQPPRRHLEHRRPARPAARAGERRILHHAAGRSRPASRTRRRSSV